MENIGLTVYNTGKFLKEQIMKNKKYIVYTKTGCPYCVFAKELLKNHDIEFDEINLDNEEVRMEFYQRHGINKVPQIFDFNGTLIGGYIELEELLGKPTGSFLFKNSTAYKPFHYQWAVDLAVEHEKLHWVETEVDLSSDLQDWKSANKLTLDEKKFIISVLRLFTQSDVEVGGNYYNYFIPKFKNNEIRNMLGSFAAREAIHQRAYALLTDTLGLPESEYLEFLNYTEMKDKVDYMTSNNVSSHKDLALAVAKSVFTEGLMLFASFSMLINFQRFGKMRGMGLVTAWSTRDETCHVEGMAKLFRTLCMEYPKIVNDEFKKSIYDIARKVVELEDAFIDLAFSNFKLEGLTKEDMKQFIRYMSDRRLLQLGLKGNFKVKENPLPWFDSIVSGLEHGAFFETRVTGYEVGNLHGDWNSVYN